MSKVLIAIAILNWGLWGFFAKIAATKMHPGLVQIIVNIICLLEIPILFLLFKKDNNIFNSQGILFAVLTGITGCIASLAFSFAIQKAEIGLMASLVTSNIVITYLLSVLFLKESFTIQRFIGILIILFGAYLVGK